MSHENETQTALKTPEEWCRIEGVQILDADGWRGRDGRDWNDPISLVEFKERLVVCTQRRIALQESPITGPQYPRPQQPGGVTIGDTSGPWLTGALITATQPAGEQHTGSLNLTGEGNEVEDETDPRLPNNIDPLAVEAATKAHVERGGWDWEDLGNDTSSHEGAKAVLIADMRVALRAAYPAVRLQVAEEIAVALEGCGRSLHKTADNTRRQATTDGPRDDYNDDRLRRVALAQDNRADGLTSGAVVAREIGRKA